MKQFVIIGCGRFGSSVAKTLYERGYDVMAIDRDEERVQEISEYVTHAVQADATDEHALQDLGISNFDVAIVTIGTNMQASILATALIKEIDVKVIYAKALNELHGRVLERVGADKVIYPEKDMGLRVAQQLTSVNFLDAIAFSKDYSIVEISVMEEWEGNTLKDLQLPNKYGINVIAIKTGEHMNISPYADDVIEKGDVLMVIGDNKDLQKLER